MGDEAGFPGIALLTGPGAAAVLERALPAGARIDRLDAAQVLGTPGRRTTVRYDARVVAPGGDTSAEMLVASIDRRGLPDGTHRVEAAGEEIAVWRAAEDPRLPALAAALDHDAVVALLQGIGLEVEGVALRVRAYRPGSRAVVEAVAEVRDPRGTLVAGPRGLQPKVVEQRVFLKAMRAPEHASLAETHRTMATVMPVARVLVQRDDGLLVLESVPGDTLRASLRRRRPVPPPSEVVALAAAPGDLDLPDRGAESADERAAWALRLLRASLPDQRERLERLADRLVGAEQQPLVGIHGDFHEGQILVENGALRGIIDLDDAGLGELVEDLGLVTGRLWVLARERDARHIEEYVAGLLASAARHVPPDELRRRVAVSLFARATAPFRNQGGGWRERSIERVRFCEEWLRRA